MGIGDMGIGKVFPDASAIPNLTDHDAVNRDLARLAELMDRDPELRKIGFSSRKTMDFMVRSIAGAPRDKEKFDRFIDELACRYVEEVEGEETIRKMAERFQEAAVRWRKNPDDLRSLVLGAFLAHAYSAGGHELNPLVCVMFRRTVFDQMATMKEIDGMMSKLGDREDLRERLLRGDESLFSDMERLVRELDTKTEQSMRAALERQMEETREIIREGRFPVPLPFCTMLPLICRVDRVTRQGRPSRKKLQKLLYESLEEIGPEDLRLYVKFLDHWVDKKAGSHPELVEAVALVRSMAAGGHLQPLDFPLLINGVDKMVFSMTKVEAEIAPDIKEDRITADSLETYANFLESKGYPALARRTRKLVDKG